MALWDWSAQQLHYWLLSQEEFATCAAALHGKDGTALASLSKDKLSDLLGSTKGPALFATLEAKLRDGMSSPIPLMGEAGRQAERQGRKAWTAVLLIHKLFFT